MRVMSGVGDIRRGCFPARERSGGGGGPAEEKFGGGGGS